MMRPLEMVGPMAVRLPVLVKVPLPFSAPFSAPAALAVGCSSARWVRIASDLSTFLEGAFLTALGPAAGILYGVPASERFSWGAARFAGQLGG